MTSKTNMQATEDKTYQYLEETNAYVKAMKQDLLNKIMTEQETSRSVVNNIQVIQNDFLVLNGQA